MNLQEARLKAIQRGVRMYLNTLSSIAGAGLSPAVEWSKQEAAANALALAEIARESDAGVEAHWQTAVIQRPEALKLFKLLELTLSARPQIEIARTAAGHGVRGRVSLHGEVIAETCAATADLAIYETLGDACMCVQLENPGASISHAPAHRRGLHMEQGDTPHRIGWIDLGFPSLATQLFAATVVPGSY